MWKDSQHAQVVVQCLSVVFLLALVVCSSLVSLTGYHGGWSKLCLRNETRESSPYAGMLKYLIIRTDDPEGLSVEFVTATEFMLPDPSNTTFDVKITLGWLQLENTVWITGGDPVADHLRTMARITSPPKYHGQLDDIFVEGKATIIEDYDKERIPAKISGIICAILLSASALLALSLLLAIGSSFLSKSTPKYVCRIVRRGHIVGGTLIVILCIEYAMLAFGTHRDCKRNPLLQKGYVPWPDWAWFSALLGGFAWMCLWGIACKNSKAVDVLAVMIPSSKSSQKDRKKTTNGSEVPVIDSFDEMP